MAATLFLSGPAGGVIGLARTGRSAGFDQVIGFDMGGTSTDVAHYRRRVRAHPGGRGGRRAFARADDADPHRGRRRRFDPRTYDGARFRVGPDPAGANPGPACYRRGGPLTVTDANVMVGKLDPATVPRHLRRRTRDQPLDVAGGARGLRGPGGRGRRRPQRRRRSPTASCRSPSPAWLRRSRRSPCGAATT